MRPPIYPLLTPPSEQTHLLHPPRMETQRLPKQLHIIAVRPRTKARIQHIIRPCHTFDDIAGEPRVDPIRRDADRLAGPNGHVVHQKGGDERAIVGFRVLVLETGEEAGDHAVFRAEVRVREGAEFGDGLRDDVGLQGEEGFADCAEGGGVDFGGGF